MFNITTVRKGRRIQRGITATGGTITYAGGYTIHTFTTNGTFTVTSAAAGATVKALVVGGGGGGGRYYSGGGGGSGFLKENAHAISAQAYSITVGQGGAACTTSSGCLGDNGTDSIFDTMTAVGGGGGRGSNGGGVAGANGGCGCGGGGTGAGAGGTGSQGGNGGTSAGSGGAGGGGAGGNGVSASGGNGGVGLADSISGTSVTYAGGGGGSAGSPGTGGSGGGGKTRNGFLIKDVTEGAITQFFSKTIMTIFPAKKSLYSFIGKQERKMANIKKAMNISTQLRGLKLI